MIVKKRLEVVEVRLKAPSRKSCQFKFPDYQKLMRLCCGAKLIASDTKPLYKVYLVKQ